MKRNLKNLQQPILVLLFLFILSSCVFAKCPDDKLIDLFVKQYTNLEQSDGFGNDISLKDAECAKIKLGYKLQEVLGRVIGYKAAFTGKALQKKFNVDAPKWGFMFEKNIIDTIAVVPANFGARPLVEADFAAVIKKPKLADAKSPLEALDYIEYFVPFIELPDIMLKGKFSGNSLVATNIAFRGGILGEKVPIIKKEEFLDTLENMTVVMTNLTLNREIGRSKGKELMGNPINSAIWLAKELKKDGINLKAGDLISLGGFIPPVPTKPGMKVKVQYFGLPNDPVLTVDFN
tara:strand:+ start:22 stop:894 length:873 start_codon:yes stop_codon:yes gene_type:complete